MEKIPLAIKSRLGSKLAASQFVAFVEILPPRGVDASKEIEEADFVVHQDTPDPTELDGPESEVPGERDRSEPELRR